MNQPTVRDHEMARSRPQGRSPAMYQTWRHLLFLHWAVSPAEIQATLPSGLTVDTFDGKAYLGVVPFFMRNIRPRFCPAVPGISNFLELNLRTYVFDECGTPGVWFYSLDANQWLAVKVARAFFHLPYFHAEMRAATDESSSFVDYFAHRKGTAPGLESRFRYGGGARLDRPEPESLEFFLVERYVLFAFDRKRSTLCSGRVRHEPYAIQEAEVDAFSSSVVELAGFERPSRPPDHALYSPGVDVKIFALQRPGAYSHAV